MGGTVAHKTFVGLFSFLLASVIGASAAYGDVYPVPQQISGHQADARIRKGNQPYIGNGVINLSGTDQSVSKTFEPGQAAEFRVRVRHAGLSVGDDKFEAFDNIGTGDPNYKVTYFFKGDNVTTKMSNGNFKFGPAIQPNESTPVLRIRVKASNDAPGGTGGFSVTTRSGTDPSEATRDLVEVATTVLAP